MFSKMGLRISVLTLTLIIIVSTLSFFLVEDIVDLTGKVVSRVEIKETPPFDCYIDLEQGRNLISFYCQIDDDVENVLKNAQNKSLNYEAIFEFNPDNDEVPWSIYNKDLPNWTVQNLEKITRREGFWLLMNEEDAYFSEGLAFFETTINLQQGWNLIGYASGFEKNVTEVFEEIDDKIDFVRTYQKRNGTKQWLSYVPGGENTIINMVPGEGYWVHAKENIKWVVTW